MLSVIVELMQEHKAALLAEGSAMAVVAANQQELMTQTAVISSQYDYVVILLEGLVGREATTETREEWRRVRGGTLPEQESLF